MERTFLDTNILVYADDADAGRKRERAQEVLGEAIGAAVAVVSTQVLQEFFVTATRKLRVPIDIARRKVQLLSKLEVIEISPALVLEAIDLHQRHGFSFWDALILRSAALARCTRLLTEDLNHGEVVSGVRIENPFTP